jgi:hypothetical protein
MVNELLHYPLFANITVLHVLIVIGAAILIGAIGQQLNRKNRVRDEHLVQKRCNTCRWSGRVSKFDKRCPKCAKPIA